jgi:hypothetical protein
LSWVPNKLKAVRVRVTIAPPISYTTLLSGGASFNGSRTHLPPHSSNLSPTNHTPCTQI